MEFNNLTADQRMQTKIFKFKLINIQSVHQPDISGV